MLRLAIVTFAAVSLIIFGCGQQSPQVDINAEKAAVKVVLDNYVKSVIDENMEAYAANIVQDSLMVNYGAMGDPIIGWPALKAVMEGQNAALSETTIDVRDLRIHVTPSGQFAWATCLWDLKAKMGEEPMQLPVRCTWILEKQANGWEIIHFHKSVAMG